MAQKLRGNTPIQMVRAGESQRNEFKPTIGTTTTIGSANQPIKSTSPMMQGSFQKMIGGDTGIGSGGFYNSMAGLEAASMRLADAASKRNIREMEAESEIENKNAALMQGYSSPVMMQYDLQKKRNQQERKQKEQEQGQYTIDRRGRRVYE
jgi:hypothetical protein